MRDAISRSLGIVGFLVLAGCAVGVTHRYDDAVPDFQISANIKRLALGIHDRRPYVVTREKQESFVGLSRGGFGNPFDINTASGRPLADDMAIAVKAALARRGVDASVVTLSSAVTEAEASKRVSAGGGKALLVTLHEWKSDTYQSTKLHYDLRVAVVGAGGQILAAKRTNGSEGLGGSFLNPPEHARTAVPVAFRRKFEELLSAPEVANGFR